MLSVLIDRDLQEREDMNAIAGGQTINSHLMDENNSSKFPFRDPNHGPQAASAQRPPRLRGGGPPSQLHARSEEHTSELQSLMRLPYAVLFFKKTKPRTTR